MFWKQVHKPFKSHSAIIKNDLRMVWEESGEIHEDADDFARSPAYLLLE